MEMEEPYFESVIPPPASVDVEWERRIILYDHHDRPLYRGIGFMNAEWRHNGQVKIR